VTRTYCDSCGRELASKFDQGREVGTPLWPYVTDRSRWSATLCADCEALVRDIATKATREAGRR
jgi:hypothetical protein